MKYSGVLLVWKNARMSDRPFSTRGSDSPECGCIGQVLRLAGAHVEVWSTNPSHNTGRWADPNFVRREGNPFKNPDFREIAEAIQVLEQPRLLLRYTAGDTTAAGDFGRLVDAKSSQPLIVAS